LVGEGGFFSLRVLLGLFILLAGVFLALVCLGILPSAVAQGQQKQYTLGNSIDPLVPAGVDCSKIQQLGIEKQENMRAGAIMIFCGEAKGGEPSESAGSSAFSKLVQKVTAPVAYGSTDVNLITGTETFPNITQSETYTTTNPDNPNQIVVAYNDSRGRNANPINISGASVSTDGGTTFTRLTRANGQSPFDNTFGDPVILYNKPSGTWFTVWLDGGCGSQGLGGYKSATPWGPNSWTHYCIHTNSSDDRESGWADNNPSSPFFGRMYVSWNDFNVGGGALFVTYSSDNGNTWHSPISVNPSFVRDVQITGDLSGNGVVYIAGMNEGGGGFPHNDTNLIFKSTDGGNTWANTYTGPQFPGPGVTAVGYFACMFSDGGGYWRHQGWGEPAAYNNVVHLVYAQHGAGSDPGDVYYIRSTDGGVTFSAPFKLNTDATTRPQWQPNLSVSSTGTLFATWYDARESASCTRGNPAVPCYRMWSRKSNDNGVTWLPDDMLSDVVTPLPAQPDSGIQATYAGDYDYGSAIVSKHLTSWVDGRVAISGASQQDVFFDKERRLVPGPCDFRVLIVYADMAGQPTMLRNQILAEPNVTRVDLFDAASGTPTLAQLQQYNIVFAFANNAWNNAVGMGDVLADYQDGGGVVVVGTFAWDNRGGWLLQGRWITGGYSPYNSTAQTNFSNNTANITGPSHALTRGVSSLSAFYRNGVALTSGASAIAMWTDGPPAVAYKTNNGTTAVGINAYLGNLNQFSGEWGRVIVNAGKWLLRRPATDFDQSGKPDYVLYNGGTRQTAVWYMNNNVFHGGVFSPTLPAGWNLIDVADFNSDGNPDYALFNPTTRNTAIWYLSGVSFIGGHLGPTLPSGWTLAATGDFNDDCKPDYVLYNASTRQTAVWYMNDNVFLSGVYGPTLPAGWALAGLADFNQSGTLDYLLFNASTRQTAIWHMNNNVFVSAAYGPTIASGYQLRGTADFNGDVNPDYLLYNPSTRQTAIWYLNNNILLFGAYGPTLTAGWSLVAP
jgi:hypothetical protein